MLIYPYADLPPLSLLFPNSLIDLLLLVNAELAGASVGEEQKTADDGKDLEEIVLGEVLVGVVLVKLESSRVSRASK